MIDWSNLGSDPAAAFEQHRQEMVAHFIMLRHLSAEVARSSLLSYISRPHCPFPKIADDVKAEWAKVVAQQKAMNDAQPQRPAPEEATTHQGPDHRRPAKAVGCVHGQQ